MSTIALQLRELITVNREQIAEMKALAAQMQKDNAEFRATMVKEFNDFKNEVREDISTFKAEVKQDISNFKAEVKTDIMELRQDVKEQRAEIAVLHDDVTGLKHDVAGLYHWDYWLLSIILVVFAMPQIVAGVKALFGAIAEGIAGIIAVFKGRGGGEA